ncbi:MAG: T9SS type A sorting domain-containing protein [Calditrichaeota bacterium]|nr:T9SS type A sorting domain-containing protein [Calditrichota bacterium]
MKSIFKLIFICVLVSAFGATISLAAIVNVPADEATIQGAINTANPGDTVLVAPDTYQELININKDITVASLHLTTGDPDRIDDTIIDGNGSGTVVTMQNRSSDCLFTGFTVQNGDRGIRVSGGAPVLNHLVLKDHDNNNLFGGGLDCANSNMTLSDALIQDNVARDGGGIAIEGNGGTVNVERVEIRGNTSNYGGGIRCLSNVTLNLTNVLIVGNTTTNIGGGINNWSSNITINMTNVTLYGNTAPNNPDKGGGIRARLGNEINMVNVIFGGNFPNDIRLAHASSVVNIDYCNFTDGDGNMNVANANSLVWGDGNIFEDPLFEDAGNGDYHLTDGSPCIDTGDPNSDDDPDGTDADMGMYYFHQNLAPEIELTFPNGGQAFEVSELITITWDGLAQSGFDYTVVFYSSDDGDNWTVIDTAFGNVSDLDWRLPITQSEDYLIKVVLHDLEEEVAEDQSNATFSNGPLTMTKNVSAGWSLISIPLIQNDMSVEAVLVDDFDFQYAVYGFNPQEGHTVPETLQVAQGYFLGIVNDAQMDVTGLPIEDEAYTFDLTIGWNMLGSSFRHTSELEDATVTIEGDEMSFEEAVVEEYLTPIMYNFYNNIPEDEPDWPDGNRYAESDQMEAWKGYWYLSLIDGVQLTINRPTAYPQPERDDSEEPSPEDWHLDIIASMGEFGDACNIGVNESATSGFDNLYDYPEPPHAPVENYVRFYHERENWPNHSGNLFNRDIRPPMERDETQEWEVTVTCGENGEVLLVWPNIAETVPYMNQITLIDPVADIEVDMINDYLYFFDYDGPRTFIIRVYSSLDVQERSDVAPHEFAILTAYPNPFNATTTIAYTVPNTSHVNLSIFDPMGRNVAELLNGQVSSGIHRAVFNAQGLESGIFIARLTSRNQTHSQKLILVK